MLIAQFGATWSRRLRLPSKHAPFDAKDPAAWHRHERNRAERMAADYEALGETGKAGSCRRAAAYHDAQIHRLVSEPEMS